MKKEIYLSQVTMSDRVDWAQRMTFRAADVKDWRLTKRGKMLKAIAKDMLAGRGYIIATSSELVARFGREAFEMLPADNGKRYIWGIQAGIANRHGRVTLGFVAM